MEKTINQYVEELNVRYARKNPVFQNEKQAMDWLRKTTHVSDQIILNQLYQKLPEIMEISCAMGTFADCPCMADVPADDIEELESYKKCYKCQHATLKRLGFCKED